MPTAWLGTLLHWGPQLHFSTSWVLPRLVDGVRVGASTSPVVVHLRDADGGPGGIISDTLGMFRRFGRRRALLPCWGERGLAGGWCGMGGVAEDPTLEEPRRKWNHVFLQWFQSIWHKLPQIWWFIWTIHIKRKTSFLCQYHTRPSGPATATERAVEQRPCRSDSRLGPRFIAIRSNIL